MSVYIFEAELWAEEAAQAVQHPDQDGQGGVHECPLKEGMFRKQDSYSILH